MRAKLSLLVLAAIAAGIGATWLAAHAGADRPTEPGPILTAARRRVADRLRTRVVAGEAGEPARPGDGADRVLLVRGIAERGDERTAVHARCRDRVRVLVRLHLHRAVVPVGTAPWGGRQGDRRGRDRRHAPPGGRDAVRERIRAAVRRRLRGQPDPDLPRQRPSAHAAQPPTGARRGPDADRSRSAVLPLAEREPTAATRGDVGAAGRKRDAARAHGHGRRRPARQPAHLGSGEGLVPDARARADRGAGHVRAAAARPRERRRTRRPAGRSDRAGGPAGGAGAGARRSVARPGVLVSRRGAVCDRRRPPGRGARAPTAAGARRS